MKIPKWRIAASLALLCAPVVKAQTAPSWTQLSPQNSPPVRDDAAMAYDSTHKQLVLFGGFNYLGAGGHVQALSDTWVWDGSNWTQTFPQKSPPAQGGHAMAYDSAHGLVIMIGVHGTWVWDGSNWTKQSPRTSPPDRANHAMAYDSAHRQVVLFGGETVTNGYLGDTWVWDGFNWTQKSPQSSPAARGQHAMVYDSARGQIVVFGGVGNFFQGHTVFSDTWVWDGSNWTKQSPQNSPPLRYSHAMAYDAAQGQTVLFGGFDENLNTIDGTWLWDGSNWTQASPPGPSSRAYDLMAYDSADGQVVLFGGQDIIASNFNDLSDTWTWGKPIVLPPPQPTISSVVNGASFASAGIAPGEIATIFGNDLSSSMGINLTAGLPLPNVFQNVTVMVNGSPAPLFAVDNVNGQQQINFQVPFGVSEPAANIAVVNNASTGPTLAVPVVAAQPGIFNYSVGGEIFGAILHANFQLADTGHPVVAGETVLIYCTGLGAVSSPPADGAPGSGQPTTTTPVVTIGGANATVSFSGLAPGFVGLYQINAKIPAGLSSGNQPVVITMGSAAGNSVLVPVH